MHDVIQKVLASEAEAKGMIEAAKADAERILSAAQKQAHDLIARTRQEARVEAEGLVETAVHAAEQEKQQRLAGIAAEIESQVRLEETAREHAVAEVIRCVCGQQQPTRGA